MTGAARPRSSAQTEFLLTSAIGHAEQAGILPDGIVQPIQHLLRNVMYYRSELAGSWIEAAGELAEEILSIDPPAHASVITAGDTHGMNLPEAESWLRFAGTSDESLGPDTRAARAILTEYDRRGAALADAIVVSAEWVRQLYGSVQYTIEVEPDSRHIEWLVIEWLVRDLHGRLTKLLHERSELEKRIAERDAEIDRLRAVETAAAEYVMAGLCGNPSTSTELVALVAAVRTNGEFRG